MKIAIIGYGRQGSSAYSYWSKIPGNRITVCELNDSVELPSDVEKRSGPDYLKNLDDFDFIIRSPIIHPEDIVAANSESILDKVSTVTNEFFKVCPTKNIIGVTGTKGKGTTSTLIAKMLEADGKKVHLGGNIGIAPLQLLDNQIKPEDWVVLELANFQLIDLKYSPPLAVCLLIAPEHLDWHKDLKEYIAAKQQLFIHQTASDKAIYYAENLGSKEVVSVSPGIKIPYYQTPGAEVIDKQIVIDKKTVCRTDELKLLGSHNWQNVCAAITAVWQVTQNVQAIRQVAISFRGLEHRLELVREIEGVKYYNDSFASVPDAAIAAMDAIAGRKVMILGGYDRQLNLENLAQSVMKHSSDITKVILIGSSSGRLGDALNEVGFKNYEIIDAKTMSRVVASAREFAKKSDSVVLSPGFPSFDMFKDFEDRGLQFKEEVQKL